MADWHWPWTRRPDPRAVTAEIVGRVRQEAAADIATVRQGRRSLEAAIRQLMATQAERGEDRE